MKILKLLNEAQSTLFHYTSIHALHKILSSKTIRLSVQRMKHEQDIAKDVGQGDKIYYMSLARSRFGEYHSYPGGMSVLLEINGHKLNSLGKIKSIDYWKAGPGAMIGAKDEMEDRFFSNNPTISIDGLIKSISVYIRPGTLDDASEHGDANREIIRQTLILCKTNKIPMRVYDDATRWKTGRVTIEKEIKLKAGEIVDVELDADGNPIEEKIKKKIFSGGEISTSKLNLKGHRQKPPYMSSRGFHNDVDPYVELLMTPITGELSAKAKKICYSIRWYGSEAASQLKNIVHNDGQAGSNHKLDTFFQVIKKLKLNNDKEIAAFIKDKWKDVKM